MFRLDTGSDEGHKHICHFLQRQIWPTSQSHVFSRDLEAGSDFAAAGDRNRRLPTMEHFAGCDATGTHRNQIGELALEGLHLRGVVHECSL